MGLDAGSPQDNSRRLGIVVGYYYLLATLDGTTVARNPQGIGLTQSFVLGFVLRNSWHIQHSTLFAKNLSKLGLPTIDIDLGEDGFRFGFWV